MKKNIFFYWSGNQYKRFVRWYKEENSVLFTSVSRESDGFSWCVRGIQHFQGKEETLSEAQEKVEEVLFQIIQEKK